MARPHQFNSVVLPEPGAPETTIDSRADTTARRNRAASTPSMPCSTNSSSEENATPVNFRMFTIRCPPQAGSRCTM